MCGVALLPLSRDARHSSLMGAGSGAVGASSGAVGASSGAVGVVAEVGVGSRGGGWW